MKHLMKQIEIYREKRQARDKRPDWITQFIEDVAELFEPLDSDGRVGFDCQLSEDFWNIGMYLGSTEHMGGPRDGDSELHNFEFNLSHLTSLFDSVHQLYWSATPEPFFDSEQHISSMISLEGTLNEQPVRLQLYSAPPTEIGPGFRQYNDGRCEAV
ncbi:hypothetical protein MNBD_PLANCTO02-3321 [hydrothermal vent metagenome]|uniref:Uncharacterized protein n=1 Tax=hydrothermal vent metagenome TaxID=652676 RepID=A0A3B1E6K5_9ZZZZ